MSRNPMYGDPARMGGPGGLPGANPRPSPGREYYRQDDRAPQAYGDPRMAHASHQPPPSPNMAQYRRGPVPSAADSPPVLLEVAEMPAPLTEALKIRNMCAIAFEKFPVLRDHESEKDLRLYVSITPQVPRSRPATDPRKKQNDHFVLSAVSSYSHWQPGQKSKQKDERPNDAKIYLSKAQRDWMGFAKQDLVYVQPYHFLSNSAPAPYLASLRASIGFIKTTTSEQFDEDELSKKFVGMFQNQIFTPEQHIIMMASEDLGLLVIVESFDFIDPSVSKETLLGLLVPETKVIFTPRQLGTGKEQFNMKHSISKPNPNAILAPDFKFEDMGIGGLGDEFFTLFRRAFASRVFPRGLVQRLGIPHVKGILLYGPPGTGKTLIARQIGKMLNQREPKVINGPEVLNKYVGQSEENIRNLFKDAEQEYKERGDDSDLHVIIFDELDAVCKQRGSGAGGGTGVGDSVVNQLLSKLDGVNQLNNILLIGMTNRKDMIDEALMRPGRLEVHLEISLPDEQGRQEILKIHTSQMRSENLMDPGVDLGELAGLTKNYSGAELNGLVKAATSYALSRHTVVGKLAQVKDDVNKIKVKREDFLNALEEVRPAFGVSEADLEEAIRLGIIYYSPHIEHTIREMMRVVEMIKGDRDKLSTSVLFRGPKASGKTALAAHIALQSDFPFIKIVTPANLVGYRDDFSKRDHIHKVFTDAYKSPASIIILDDFERLIGWNPIGPRFSNTMLEALTTLIVSKPPKGHRLLIFVTTSKPSVLKLLEVDMDFAKKVEVPAVSHLQELAMILEKSGVFDSSAIQRVIDVVGPRTESRNIDVGVKTVLDCVFEARSGGGDIVEAFTDLLFENIQW